MKTYLTAAAAMLGVVVFSGAAVAGPGRVIDSKDAKMSPAMEQPICTWTGFYIGGHVGYAGGDFKWIDQAEATDETGTDDVLVDQNRSGFITGGQVGYNYQWRQLVLGVEGDFSYSDIKSKDFQPGESNSLLFETRNDWSASVGLRVGYAYNKWLFYVKGAAAFSHEKYSLNNAVAGGADTEGGAVEDAHVDTFKADEVRVAPLVAGGVEYAFNCHWSARVEYSHVFSTSDDVDGTNIDDGTAEPETIRTELDQNAVRFGINYKF